MKSLISTGPGQIEFGNWEEPSILPGQVLIEVAACGICGTDLHVYKGMPAAWPVPGIRGHEFAGTVIAWADDVEGFQAARSCGGAAPGILRSVPLLPFGRNQSLRQLVSYRWRAAGWIR